MYIITFSVQLQETFSEDVALRPDAADDFKRKQNGPCLSFIRQVT